MKNYNTQSAEFQKVERQLKAQSVLFWIMGSLGVIFSLILLIAGVAFNIDFFEDPIRAFSSSEQLNRMDDGEVMYLFFFLYVLIGAILQIINGSQIRKKKNRGISLFVATYTLFAFPFGTALAIYSLIMISLPQTKEFYFTEEEKRMELLLKSVR